jgi:hypothetical protein
VAVTVSAPAGAFEVKQVPAPPARMAVHKVVDPTVKVTVPVGVPTAELTVVL